MGTEVLERRFAAIGARVKVDGRAKAGATRIDVRWIDRASLRLRFAGATTSAGRHRGGPRRPLLLLLVRDGGEKGKFLCGYDERHWFVAAIPEGGAASAASTSAKACAAAGGGPRRPLTGCGQGSPPAAQCGVRPAGRVVLPAGASLASRSTSVRRDEPLSRGRGKVHVLALAFRRGGETVFVNAAHPSGITEASYERLSAEQRRGLARMVRDPELYAKGAVRHPDHNTIVPARLAPRADEHRAVRACDAARRVPRLTSGGAVPAAPAVPESSNRQDARSGRGVEVRPLSGLGQLRWRR